MNIIIPMAGMGKRMRPHTLVNPKPLFKIAGKTIVERLIRDLADTVNDDIKNIGFVVGRFGATVENYLIDLAKELGAKGHIFYQDDALGTAHAVYMAKDILEGKCVVAFADTLFSSDVKLEAGNDNIIWTYEVENPEAYGVVKEDSNGIITDFIEKPQDFVSKKAIIGIYYFSKGEKLRSEIDDIIENDIKVGTEYQLTTALENLKNKGDNFRSHPITGWYDCGNWNETIKTNRSVLSNIGSNNYSVTVFKNSVIIDPVYIGDNVKIENSVVGPCVTVDNNVCIVNSILKDCIINENSVLSNINISESIIGRDVEVVDKSDKMNIGDYTKIE